MCSSLTFSLAQLLANVMSYKVITPLIVQLLMVYDERVMPTLAMGVLRLAYVRTKDQIFASSLRVQTTFTDKIQVNGIPSNDIASVRSDETTRVEHRGQAPSNLRSLSEGFR